MCPAVERTRRLSNRTRISFFPNAPERTYDAYLDARGLVRRGRVGAAPCMLMDSPAMVAAVAGRLRREPGWLLCNTFGCEPCTLRKRRLRALGKL